MSERLPAGETQLAQRANGEIVALFRGTVYRTKTPFFSDTE